MKHLKILGLAAMAALAVTAFLGVGAASATKLYKFTTPSANDPLGVGTVIKASMKAGTSAIFKDTNGATVETCTSMEGEGKIEVDAGTPRGKAAVFTFGGCSHTLDTIKVGELWIEHIAGTTNGAVWSAGTEATLQSTIFGISCIAKTGTGVKMGTLTGATSSTGQAVIDMNAVIPMGICGDGILTGTGQVTAPLGLIVEAK
jgi:hypothetical protein